MSGLRSALIALSASYFFVGATSLAVIGLVEEMRSALAVSAAEVAALMTVFALVYAVAAPGLQALIGHFSRRAVLAAGLGLAAASCLLAAAAPDYPTLVAARVLMALGAALVGPTALSAAVSLAPPEARAAAIATVFTGMTLSTVLGGPLSAWLGQTFGWRWAWVALAAGALAVLPAVLRAVPAADRGAPSSLGAILGVLRHRPLALSISTTALNMTGQFATYALIAAWLTEVAGAAHGLIPAALLLYGIGGVAGNALAPFAERRLGPPRTVLMTLGVVAATLFLIWAFAPSGWAALALVFVWAMFTLMYMAPLQTRLVGLDPARAPLSLALNGSAVYVGMSVGSSLSGLVYERAGPEAMPLVSVLVMLLAMACFAASLRR